MLNIGHVSKSIGPDNISNVILKNCASQLAPGLSAIFQKSIDCGDLPEDWVNANISPVFKKVALNSGLYDGFLFYVIIYSPEV